MTKKTNDVAYQSIETRVLPCTNTKPTRIRATASGGVSLLVSKSEAEHKARTQYGADTDYLIHRAVADSLSRSLGWDRLCKLVGGATRRGYVFVQTDL